MSSLSELRNTRQNSKNSQQDALISNRTIAQATIRETHALFFQASHVL